uniref:Uncharacterized protein n=1 Tax=Ananas comosus var. bracteatus TaxID=296719 RepID=A0A6V7NWS8_ANACO|nr:unnamed protein product [Ananas comosus var. bracteatus]
MLANVRSERRNGMPWGRLIPRMGMLTTTGPLVDLVEYFATLGGLPTGNYCLIVLTPSLLLFLQSLPQRERLGFLARGKIGGGGKPHVISGCEPMFTFTGLQAAWKGAICGCASGTAGATGFCCTSMVRDSCGPPYGCSFWLTVARYERCVYLRS